MNTVDNELVDRFRRRATKALQKIGEELGIDSIALGTITYGKDDFHCTLRARVLPTNESGDKISKEEADWNKFCRGYGLAPNDRNKIVNLSGWIPEIVKNLPTR